MRGYQAFIRFGFTVVAFTSVSALAYKYPAGRTFQASFEESAGSAYFTDLIDHTARGSCAGASCPTSGVRGTTGSGLRFDGTSDCLNYWNLPALNLSAPFTISGWFILNNLPSALKRPQVIASKYDSAKKRQWSLQVEPSSNRLQFSKSWDGVKLEYANSRSVVSANALNQWIHVAFRMDATGAWALYRNGVVDSTGKFSNAKIFSGKAEARVGCVARSSTAPDVFFAGKIDEVTVFNRALSTREVGYVYSNQKPTRLDFAWVNSSPRTSSGSIDYTKLKSMVSSLRMDTYETTFQHNASPYPNEYKELPELLSQLKSTGVKVRPLVTGFNLKSRRPYYHDYEGWGAWIGQLSKTNSNLDGIVFDDFFAPSQPGDNSFADQNYMRKVCRAIKGQNPKLKVYVTLYCGWPMETGKIHQAWTQQKTHERAFVDFVKDPELNACITGVHLYTHPSMLKSPATVNGCVNTLRMTNKEIVEGVYISSLAKYPILGKTRSNNIAWSRQTRPDGYVFYMAPQWSEFHPDYTKSTEADILGLFDTMRKLMKFKDVYPY